MIKKTVNWVRKNFAALALATASVEKNVLGQNAKELEGNISNEQRHNQGTLADSLERGEITQEVKELRWRMFKILEASDKMMVSSISVDGDGYHELDVKKYDSKTIKSALRKVNVDDFDDYPLEMVIDNKDITLSNSDVINDNIKIYDLDERQDSVKEISGDTSATLGEISSEEYHSTIKAEKPIKVVRDLMTKFNIENYTKKLNIRSINDNEKLLEFYVSKYPDEFNRKSRLFLSELKRVIDRPRNASMLELSGVGFTTYKSTGVKDFHQYQYQITKFDKIIEFNGHYVIKFKANVIVNGIYLLEKYRLDELDKKYEKKERKN